MNMTLFRQEAINHQSQRLTGAITLTQPMSIKLTVTLLVAITASIILFLLNAEYSRKETVRGFLMPNKGVIKSFAPRGGTIEKLWVKEGDNVEEGAALVTLVIHQTNADGQSLGSQLIGRVEQQLDLVNSQISQHKQLERTELINLTSHEKAIAKEQTALSIQATLAQDKLALLQSQQENLNLLNKNGYASTFEAQRYQQAILDAQQDNQQIQRLLVQAENQVAQINHVRRNIPHQYTLQVNTLLRQKAELENQLAQYKNQHRYTVTASHAGTVTGIQVLQGETLSSSKSHATPLLHILPAGSELIAEILLPTRSAGFITLGQETRLRFDAFPYQRFGFIKSEITRVDRALISPNEISLPIQLQEPVYRLQASLNQQQVNAYGKAFPLKSGMLLQADIMLEKRSLVEWLLEPIYSLKGRIS